MCIVSANACEVCDLFLGETGGFMGLLLGAIALTLAEILDLVLYKVISKVFVTWLSRTHINTSFWDTLAYGVDIHQRSITFPPPPPHPPH